MDDMTNNDEQIREDRAILLDALIRIQALLHDSRVGVSAQAYVVASQTLEKLARLR